MDYYPYTSCHKLYPIIMIDGHSFSLLGQNEIQYGLEIFQWTKINFIFSEIGDKFQ